MADRIDPAVTPEQWADFRRERSWGGAFYDEYVGSDAASCAENIALNNDALPDDDLRKITRKAITDIRESALLAEDALVKEYGRQVEFRDGAMREQWGRVPNTLLAMIQRTKALADALESYLPPEP